MKIKIATTIILTSLAFCGLAHAENPGFYIGGGLGYSNLSNFEGTSKKPSTDGGVGGTVFVGYNFDSFIGVEASYRIYNPVTYQVALDLTPYRSTTVDIDYHLKSINFVGKGYFSISNQIPFNFYMLAGLSEIYGNADAKIHSTNSKKIASFSENALTFTVGAGLSYVVNSHVTTKLEYSYTGGQDGDEDHIGIPQSNLVTFNIMYNFV